VEKNFGFMSLVANVGYRHAGNALYREMDYRDRIPMSVGVSVPVTRSFGLQAEAAGFRSLKGVGYQNPAEFYLGGQYLFSSGLTLTGGTAIGATNSVASADYRVMMGLKFRIQPASAPVTIDQTRTSQAKAVFTPREITVSEEVLFKHDSDELLPRARSLLDDVAKLILENQGNFRMLEIEGHTNELGSDAYNLVLARKRAAAVRKYLSSKGVDASLLTAAAYGERRPKAWTQGMKRAEWLRINRRVEFKVVQ
jgi:outer membrane protein OmpA-like peptidoglycan-associated protein